MMKGKDYAYSQLADYDLRFMVISASEANQGVAGALPPARYYCYIFRGLSQNPTKFD